MDKDWWFDELRSEETRLGYSDGFKFVYGPWETLANREVAFLSLNPGRAPDGEPMRVVSDERGNSYEVNRHVTKSPINRQFLSLAGLLGVAPADILTGVAAPFRSHGWTDVLTEFQKTEALALGRKFWREPLRRPGLKLIFACSGEAARLVRDITEATLVSVCSAAWGNQKLRRYEAAGDRVIVHLPHLSHFQLFWRPQSVEAIRRILE